MDPSLARAFVTWATTWSIPASAEIDIEQQHVPGQKRSLEEGDRPSVPDAAMWTEEHCLIIESKISSRFDLDQIQRHYRMVEHSFDEQHVQVLVITADDPPTNLPTWATHKSWQQVFAWMGEKRQVAPRWTEQYREFARLLEAELLAEDQTYAIRKPLTMFDGIHFSDEHPYGAREARVLIKQVMSGLSGHAKIQALGVAQTAKGRPAITGRGDDAVWDFLPLWQSNDDDAFTRWPHLTVGLDATQTSIGLTIPNGVDSGIRGCLAALTKERFVDLIADFNTTVANVAPDPGIQPSAVVVQRHYLYRKIAVHDVDLHIDLRAITGGDGGKIKANPLWIEALYQSLTARSGANVQVEIGAHFPTKHGALAKANAIELLAGAFSACGPLIKLLRTESNTLAQ